ncbi:MAG: hypothetical protein SPJ76_05800 [Candidatus Enterosoma sp.]|nr:hypothetical protein [Mollicutes bacterium]MDY5852394.1 hypothetical protein [Candidatus Enterosoma sp.]
MKTRKTKLAAIMLSSARGLAFIGSIGGTIAWYQYSTLATAAVSGSSAKCTENLQVAVGTGEGLTFKSSLTTDDISAYLQNTRADADKKTVTVLKPVTAGNQEKDATLNGLKSNPVYQHGPYADWEDAVNTDYVTFPLTFRVLDIDGNSSNSSNTLLNRASKLGLSDITIEGKDVDGNNAEGKTDISSAIRVHFSSKDGDDDVNRLVSKDGVETVTHGPLDLNDDGDVDTMAKYEWDQGTAIDTAIDYGSAGSKETSYSASNISVKDADGINYTNYIGVIPANQTLTVNVTIFREGWQVFEGSTAAIWDATKVIGANYRVGRSFEIPKLEKHNSVPNSSTSQN